MDGPPGGGGPAIGIELEGIAIAIIRLGAAPNLTYFSKSICYN
jgi:hypothetical protein